MTAAGTVRGVVTDHEGRPVPRATVVVVDGTAPVPEIALVTDDAGRFGLKLPRGRFTLEAQGEGGAKGQTIIEVAGPSHDIRSKFN